MANEMMKKDIRYGVIGTGMMGIEHIENIDALNGTVVTAVSDPDPTSRSAGQRAAQLHDGAAFADHSDLLSSGLVDAVVVASPNYTHAEILHDVIRAGVHFLAEKPLCTTVDDALLVAGAARESDVVAWMGLEYRYKPAIARLIDVVESGVVGTVRMVAIREHRFPFLEKVGNWNRFNRFTGGTLVEKCCHFFDLMNLITSARPVSVFASGAQDVNHLDETYEGETPDILDNAFVIVDYDNGSRALLDLCMFSEGSKNEQEISVVGDRAKVEAFVPEDVVRYSYRDGSPVRDVPITDDRIKYEGLHGGASFLEHLDFLEAVRNGTEAKVTLDDGMLAVAIGVAAQQSVVSGRPVMLTDLID